MSKNRRYDQYCPVCHALELVGERWALLVVRELLKGPKRYTDLLEGMPGVGTNILASRLRELEAGGILQKRRLPPPAASTVYELTDYGRELEEPLYALARWGARTLPPPVNEDFYPEWGLNAFPALLDPDAARGVIGRTSFGSARTSTRCGWRTTPSMSRSERPTALTWTSPRIARRSSRSPRDSSNPVSRSLPGT